MVIITSRFTTKTNTTNHQVNITSGKDFCLAFTRSMPGQLTLGFREQMNQITSFADSSNVYGR